MGDRRVEVDKKGQPEVIEETSGKRERLRELCECDRFLEDEEVLAHGRIIHDVDQAADNVSSCDEVDEFIEDENRRLNDLLNLPVDTYSLTLISPKLPTCVKHGVRSGLTHHRMDKFSPLSRGFQGPAIAIAAFATTALMKARCWNEMIIDQIVDDGDTYYCESYSRRHQDDRKTFTILDLDKDLIIQKTHRVFVSVEEPAYAGTFRSKNPTNLHLVKGLELFFKRYDAGVLVSPVLNIAIWRDAKYFNIFDGQARRDNLLPTADDSGAAKLILVRDLTGVLFVILEKSGVKNEHFVLYGVGVRGIERLPLKEDDPEEPDKSVGKPKRRPSGYKIQGQYRALVQGSFHLNHDLVPKELQGRGHLMIALAALIYSRLIQANKWTSALIDLIFNQAHIYLVDLARVLEKKLDDTFELKIDDVMGDIVLGVYAAKINVRVNVVPGQAKKGKATIDTGFRDFFKSNNLGVLEIKKIFYAVWNDGDKYYFLDPFACDDEGFRVDPADPENIAKYKKALPCVTMNSSVNELIETILENTGNKEKDPFILHGLGVLYVKTGPSLDTVIYREKKTNRRPLPPQGPKPEEPDDCKIVMDMVPRPRPDAEKTKEIFSQFPELMKRVEEYMMKDDEPTTFVEEPSEKQDDSKEVDLMDKGDEENEEDTPVTAVEEVTDETTLAQVHFEGERPSEVTVELDTTQGENNPEVSNEEKPQVPNDVETTSEQVKFIKGYSIINPHRLLLHGSENCLSEKFEERSRGRQGLALALTAIAYSKIKDLENWRNVDVDQILRVGDQAHQDIVTWIRQGSPEMADEPDKDEGDKEDEEEDEEDEEDEEEEEGEGDDEEGEGGKLKTFKGVLKPTPSHIEVSMLPAKIKLGDNRVTFLKKQSVIDGDADPLANLGEALECYFEKYSEAILENRRLMYGIWKRDDKYFVLNPYGSDEEGWRQRDYPASLVVTDTINELVDLFHAVLEFNDRMFSLHFVGIEAIQPGDKYVVPFPLEIPADGLVEKFRTRFLPVTDEDLFVPEVEPEAEAEPAGKDDKKGEDEEDEEDEEEDEEDEADEEEGEGKEEDEDKEQDIVAEPEKPLEDPILEIEEQEFPDAPDRLNLSLLTGSVKIEEDIVPDEKSRETVLYERLKYSHPPPYVLPPDKVLCVLLNAKKASGSMHSIISRFSIDSKLAVKAATDLTVPKTNEPVTVVSSPEKLSKMIKLPPKKYLFSRIPPIGITPLRAINEKYIQDEDLDRAMEEECRRKKEVKEPEDLVIREIPEDPIAIRIKPEIIPLGPTIKTPTPKKKLKPCAEHSKIRKCKISEADKEDTLLRKMFCDTEDVVFDMLFPKKVDTDIVDVPDDQDTKNEDPENSDVETKSDVRIKINDAKSAEPEVPEFLGFMETEDNVGIIQANRCLKNREQPEACHFKACFFAAILSILAKVLMDVNRFSGTVLDQFIMAAEKIYQRTGKLRYKQLRWFHNVAILDAKCNVIMKQSVYADPENCEADELSTMLKSYLDNNKSGILVFENASYAFWTNNEKYYLFDPYACDDRGRAGRDGSGCLLEFCDFEVMIDRIRENNGTPAEDPYRIYSLSIAHMETKKGKKPRKKRKRRCPKKMSDETILEESLEIQDEPDEVFETKREVSLVEMSEWMTQDDNLINKFDLTIPGFAGIKNFNASALEVPVVENDITTPIQAPFKKVKKSRGRSIDPIDPPRKKIYDRKFKEQTSLNEPIDLCIMAWSSIHDPTLWGSRTIRGIYEASKDLTFDSLLSAADTNPTEMMDGVLTEFSIGNYSFRAVFAPLHHGKLYAMEGWNLAMSLKKLFEIPIYSGAILICGKSHIGLMKKGVNHYAWWTVTNTKNLRIITSEELEDFLKLVVKAIGESEEKDFLMRVVTISYARKLDPDCSDMYGLHEPAIPSTSLAQIHRKESPPYDLDDIFRPTVPTTNPIFVLGSVALRNRDILTEPRVKRCYFVAALSVMVKRDIVQSPMPAMIDRVIEVAENLYREFDDPKYHTEHIIRNVTLMNRIFDLRDCASPMFTFKVNPSTGKTDFYSIVRKQLKKHFTKHDDGIVHFTNCCYGFWYSRATNAYYYLDPYQCNSRGRRVNNGGNGCLCVLPTICQMVKQWCVNRFEDTTGFFIHRLHVESINVPPYDVFREDPMWVYLDYHWSFDHSSISTKLDVKPSVRKKRTAKDSTEDLCKETEKEERSRPSWNNYTIEVPNLLYSVWGTIGCYDSRFGDRAGRNRNAIVVAILAMRHLCQPSCWGAAILDSAVICGDSYYTESTKSSVRRGSRYPNRFDLQPCFKVFPHIWSIDFLANMCGILYGGRDRPDLATTLAMAFEESPNLLVECARVSLAVLSTEDAFYVIDPCWTGPPLFVKNHGAVYGLRCKNMKSLVYAIAKILNTNQRLEFRVTPILLKFSQEICKFTDKRRKTTKKEILMDPLGDRPGIAEGPDLPVSGAITHPDEDSFLLYRRNLRLGILHGPELENPPPTSPVPWMNPENVNNCAISTTWHLNIGHPSPKKRSHPPFVASILEHDPRQCQGMKNPPIEIRKPCSITEQLRLCDDYPRTIDLAAGKSITKSKKIFTRRKIIPEVPLTKPLECIPPRNFLMDSSRREFARWNKVMADEAYKTVKHRISDEETDVESSPAFDDEDTGAKDEEDEQTDVEKDADA